MSEPRPYGLSIDPNTKRTGICGWLGNVPNGTRTVKAKDGWREMAAKLAAMLETARPDWVAVEGVYMGVNARTTIDLSKLVGAVELACYRAGVTCFTLTTREIDEYAGLRYDNGGRKLACKALAEWQGLTVANQDEADAVAVGMAGYARYFEHKLQEANGHAG